MRTEKNDHEVNETRTTVGAAQHHLVQGVGAIIAGLTLGADLDAIFWTGT
jgi:hypothetical protein